MDEKEQCCSAKVFFSFREHERLGARAGVTHEFGVRRGPSGRVELLDVCVELQQFELRRAQLQQSFIHCLGV